MSQQLGLPTRPLRVAIIGAGPAGFYTAHALFQHKELQVTVDLFERLPAPYGLVRYGVAPDHQKIKAVTKVFERDMEDARFRFFGNVTLGREITLTDLRRHYDQIVYAVGAQSDRKLNIPGEALSGSLSATEFVAWYNGHPDFVELPIDLNCQSVVVVGVGNVALDVARILARSVDELKATDISDPALTQLAESQIKDIYILARRGPAQGKFTPTELKEFGELAGVEVIVDPDALILDSISQAEADAEPETQRNLAALHGYAEEVLHRQHEQHEQNGQKRRLHFCFLRSPVEIIGTERVEAVKVEKNELRPAAQGGVNAVGTGVYEMIPAGLVLRSVGYKGIPLDGVPYDARSGTIPNLQGRVIEPESGRVRAGEYVAGWAKRGPSGVIGTNRPDALETMAQMLADLETLVPAACPCLEAIPNLLNARQVRFVSKEAWHEVDQAEIARGQATGRPRIKYTSAQQMFG